MTNMFKKLIDIIEPDFVFSAHSINRFKVIESNIDNKKKEKVEQLSKLREKLSLKLMYGESDMIKSGGELIGFGFDYKIAKPLKLYVNYVEKNFDDIGKSSEEIMFGIQYKFDFGLF